MCGHFIMVPRDEIELIIRDIEIENHVNVMPDWPARIVDAYPGSTVPLIVSTREGLKAEEMTWGYTIPNKSGLVFNARSETALSESSMWRDSLTKRRCAVPTFGFFEPHKTELSVSERTGKPIKRPYRFDGPRSLLFLAGIYQSGRFSIMTTAPNASVEPVHDRMPVVLLEHELPLWFSPDFMHLFDRTGIELIATAQEPAATDLPAPPSKSSFPDQPALW
ncbi:SOS response-associated peptidase [Raoultibacter phocaeensis]|uniref:SOS response-associated peptidase n=1 Tax=Raoultibacter phocaeensis TaxID=2479841 RepID=UPI0015D65F34|nr:SOS response-associated peptidase family protein [Raoultibacter phocaeensis]